MLAWVVGSGGLLGGAVARAARRRFLASPVPWTDPESAARVLESDLARFATAADGGDWALVWAAGGGVVASSVSELRTETAILERFLAALRLRRPRGRGALFLASSAGGVYAASTGAPFDEHTQPHPVSAYGAAKLAQEELATTTLADAVPIALGRISNLYGPGQNLAKPQGLVSQLCLAAARRTVVNLFVPMETLRDYLYVDDAAAMIAALVSDVVRNQPEPPVLRNLVSGRSTPVAGVVRVVQQIARRPVRIALGSAPSSREQVRDLRVVTRFTDGIARTPITPLPAGVKRVYEHTLAMLSDPVAPRV